MARPAIKLLVYNRTMGSGMRIVAKVGVLFALVIVAIVFVNRSDAENGANQTATTTTEVVSSLGGNQSRYAPVTLVGGANYNLDAVVSERPVVFWFWAPG